ncbi:MAG: nucleotidyl transferase AbiEii/AbiGii toxin family protein [Planctomycetaceae bacterium]|nr:nucleotidyl transferase AbiEii/AbiGii toxin family protein [Planctomycetaceae bacterium]
MFPIEAFEKTLSQAAAIFDRLSLPYHLTGGVSTVSYGEPRMTQDLDIVVHPRKLTEKLDDFLKALADSSFLYSESAIREAVEKGRVFQILHQEESLKLDIYPREMIPGELQRSVQRAVITSTKYPIVSRPDAILSKLIWVSKGNHKNRQDVRRLFRTSTDEEQALVRDFAKELKLSRLLTELLEERDEPIE